MAIKANEKFDKTINNFYDREKEFLTSRENFRMKLASIILEEENDKITGVELGADDYITKPFSTKEVIARVKANIRRVRLSKVEEEMKSKIVAVGNLTIDMNTYEVSKDGKIIDLTNREFDLLKYLFQNCDRVFNREHLLKEVWGYEFGDLRTVDVTVRRLREKIETEEDKYIITKRGMGYYFKSR